MKHQCVPVSSVRMYRRRLARMYYYLLASQRRGLISSETVGTELFLNELSLLITERQGQEELKRA